MEQDKAGKFLDEMRPKLLALEPPHSAEIFSDTTSKFYPVRTSNENGVFELSIKVPYHDLDCTERRFLDEKNIDFSMDGESMTVCVRKNGFGKKVVSQEYWRVKAAVDKSLRKFEQERLSGAQKPEWYRKRQGLR